MRQFWHVRRIGSSPITQVAQTGRGLDYSVLSTAIGGMIATLILFIILPS